MELTNPSTIIHLLKKYNLWTKKSLGQNFLIDKKTLDRIVAAAELTKEDLVVEIGTGLGTLTRKLTESTNKVISIEIDQSMKQIHQQTIPDQQVVYADALDIEPPQKPYKVIANIPYYITSPLLSHFLKNEYLNGNRRIPVCIVMLIQKETAEKLCAKDKLNVLALNTQPFGRTEIVKTVSRDCFFPKPKVGSAIIKITPYPCPLVKGNLKRFYQIVQAGFSHKRKKLVNALASKPFLRNQNSKKWSEILLKKADIDPNRRAETLSIEEWNRLNQELDR